MFITGLKGQKIKLKFKPSDYPLKSEGACRSKLQYQCGQMIKKHYPMDIILEDYPVPEHNFYFDFFLPNRKIVIEVQGLQHDEFVPFFHKDKSGFEKHKDRDNNKRRLCVMNEIDLYEIRSLEDLENLFDD